MTGHQDVLQIENVSVSIGTTDILKNISWSVGAGQTLGLVGESGSGKSINILTVAGLLPDQARITGSVKLNGKDILEADEATLCQIRGAKIGVVFQEPMTALNPLHTIGQQVAEVVRIHTDISKAAAETLAGQTLKRVGLDPAEISPRRYPHELSGGQRQRVAIAMAIILKPDVILADEPTTALDVTTQAEVLDLLATLAKEDGCALVMVTHDLPLLSGYADKIAIMKDGEIVEQFDGKPTQDKLKHAYSKALFEAALYKDIKRKVPKEMPALEVRNLNCEYSRKVSLFKKHPPFRAVKNVSFTLKSGETLALVGESGCGKSTLSKAILGLQPIAGGQILLAGKTFVGQNITLEPAQMRVMREKLQMVFQDPYGSFNPRHKARRIIAEPFWLLESPLTKTEIQDRVAELLISVGLAPKDGEKFPHEFSGGQRQRIAIARALATNPDVIVLDEAVSALDVTVRAQILDLLTRLRREIGVAYLFVSHDMSVVRGFAHRVMVMKAGEIVAIGDTERLFQNPSHAYTRQLIEATPEMVRD